MTPTRSCLDCGALVVNASRCPPCHRAKRKKMYDNREWRKLRAEVVKASPVCATPGCGATTDLTADHVKAGTLAGGVRTLCRRCNSSKGDR